ncbi:MAG: exodeoxyribonuclease VII large subunit [Porticoccaceae bacterium]|nr:exodeoxyribonuclease VII large subunit [Porticoccaceae bacterium]
MTLQPIYPYNKPMNSPMKNQPSERQIFSISELNRRVRQLLETHLPLLWVEGEISNFACPASGHWYLSLKDNSAQVRCVMFRNANQRVAFRPQNGNQVLVRCRVGLYEDRGDYQLIIEHMEEAGFGALQRQFEILKGKLAAEGLFEAEKKQPIPKSVAHIGVITSTTGAAVRDILSVLNRRFPAIKVSVFPTAVQGDQAAQQIVSALADANSCEDLDLLIVSRGGGSLEDLWPFNNEAVARAIDASRLPVISAVGHEVDFTIADFVADLRAPTPSAAAELVSPNGEDIQAQFANYKALLTETVQRVIRQYSQQLTHLHKRLQHPGSRLQQQTQHLDHLDIRLRRAMAAVVGGCRVQTDKLTAQLLRQSPKQPLQSKQQQLSATLKQLYRAISQLQNSRQNKVTQAMHLLDTVSPLKTIGRGYAIIRDTQGEIINSVSKLSKGEQLKGQVKDGEILFEVTDTNSKTLAP